MLYIIDYMRLDVDRLHSLVTLEQLDSKQSRSTFNITFTMYTRYQVTTESRGEYLYCFVEELYKAAVVSAAVTAVARSK